MGPMGSAGRQSAPVVHDRRRPSRARTVHRRTPGFHARPAETGPIQFLAAPKTMLTDQEVWDCEVRNAE